MVESHSNYEERKKLDVVVDADHDDSDDDEDTGATPDAPTHMPGSASGSADVMPDIAHVVTEVGGVDVLLQPRRPSYLCKETDALVHSLGLGQYGDYSTNMKLCWRSNLEVAGLIHDLMREGERSSIVATCRVHDACRCMVTTSYSDPQDVLDSLVLWLSEPGDGSDSSSSGTRKFKNTYEQHQTSSESIRMGYGMKLRRSKKKTP